MLHLTSDDSGASQLIGYVYTALISVLLLSSMMLTSSTMLNGSISNTTQEEAEQLALYFQLAIEDLLNTIREYPTSSPVMVLDTGIEAINHNLVVMASNTPGGNKEIIDNTNGVLFNLAELDKTIDKIKNIKNNYNNFQIKLKSKKNFLKNFIEEKSNSRFLEILNKIKFN